MIHPADIFGLIVVMVLVSTIGGYVAAYLSGNRWVGFAAGVVLFAVVDRLLALVVVYD